MTATVAPYVLVVEDNPMNADVLRENLVDVGYTFVLAVNGAAGVAVANDILPDIILMDVNLPILDGLSATRLLKKNTSTQGIPIIALTARAMSGDHEMCLAAGCDDYVSKPVDIDLLLSKMRQHLDRRPPSFVEMIRRQRTETGGVVLPLVGPLKPGMAPRDYEEEFSNLNGTVERMESNLRVAEMRISELDGALGERESQFTTIIQERDAALGQLTALTEERNVALGQLSTLAEERDAALGRLTALAEERDRLRADRDALKLKRDALQAERDELLAGREPASMELAKRAAEDLDRATRRSRKLAQQLELAQQRCQELQQQVNSLPGDIRTLQAQHDTLRKAFLQLHRSVLKSAEEALHQVAFGGS